jgi:hypothetical protein
MQGEPEVPEVPKEMKEPKKPKKSRSLKFLYAILIVWYVVSAFQGSGKYILSESISNESDFQVNLIKGVSYNIEIENFNGPEKINLTVSNGSSTAFEGTFSLTESKKNYFPYHPKFTVEENGTYHVHAKPMDSGTVNLTIKESISPKYP